MNEIMEKIFNATLGSSLKFVTNDERPKGLRNTVFGIIMVLGFVFMFTLLYLATLFDNIFVWVFFVTLVIVIVDSVLTFMKKYMAYNSNTKALKDEEN